MSLLTDSSRSTLENIIDNCIVWIPEWVPEYRKEGAKKMWMYEKAEDFVLGLIIGMIYANFESFFLTTRRKQLDPQERTEVMMIIFKRIEENQMIFLSSRMSSIYSIQFT
jgi:hypothetical protein